MAKLSKEKLIKLQKRLKRDAAIGAEVGITRQAVHQLRKKYGIPSVIENNPQRDKEIIKQYKQGTPVADIAKAHDLSISYTYRIISESKGARKAAKKAPKKAPKKAQKKAQKKAATKKKTAKKAKKAPKKTAKKAPKSVKKTAKKTGKKAAKKSGKKAAKKK
ncbi:MAG: histone [Chitinivibrionales bacterium]|nr:histone [Chitinivibrionales bacterium]